MAIPASQIVKTIPRVMSAGSNELDITGLLLTKNKLMPFPHVLEFPDSASVGAYFGTDSEEYSLAQSYFLGYDNSFRKPVKLSFAKRVDEAIGAFLQGAPISYSLEQIKAITDGAFIITVNDIVGTVDDLDFSGVTTWSDVAAVIKAKMTDVDVTYSSLTKGLTIITTGVGADKNISYVIETTTGTDLSNVLGLSKSAGSTLSIGSDVLDAGSNMDTIKRQTENWVTFTNMYPATDDEIMDFAKWSNNQLQEYLYCFWLLNDSLINQTANNTISDKLLEENIGATTGTYGDVYYAVFIMAIAASVAWERRSGAISFAFKSQEGLAPTVTDGLSSIILEERKINFYGRYATRSDDFIHLYPGAMFGTYGYIDSYVNSIWLRNLIQTALYDGIKNAGRLPYTEGGYTQVRAWMTDPVNRALNNGVIEPGVTLNERQKSELFVEAGQDISTDLWIKGYYMQVLDPGTQARENRDSPIINLWYTYGGSINKLQIASTAIL